MNDVVRLCIVHIYGYIGHIIVRVFGFREEIQTEKEMSSRNLLSNFCLFIINYISE